MKSYFHGKTIVLSGGTTFLGTVLLENIIRILPNISKIIVLFFTQQNDTKPDHIRQQLLGIFTFIFVVVSFSVYTQHTHKHISSALSLSAC
jgi:FlaA1/EpsC-like NDP-sugar epimerase